MLLLTTGLLSRGKRLGAVAPAAALALLLAGCTAAPGPAGTGEPDSPVSSSTVTAPAEAPAGEAATKACEAEPGYQQRLDRARQLYDEALQAQAIAVDQSQDDVVDTANEGYLEASDPMAGEGDPSPAAAEVHDGVPHFGYSGACAPQEWGQLASAWQTCETGQAQSPVDIVTQGRPEATFDLLTEYRQDESFTVVNNGHTLEVRPVGPEPSSAPEPSSPAAAGEDPAEPPRTQVVSFGGQRYGLLQVHFHAPSEHTVDGGSFPLEAHFVHALLGEGDRVLYEAQSAPGEARVAQQYAVIAVLVQQGEALNTAWDSITASMPFAWSPTGVTFLQAFSPEVLLPTGSLAYYGYEGSLTTPGCAEKVHWLVMQEPVAWDAAQIAAFTDWYPDNHRPVQQVDGRSVTLYE